MEHLAPRECIVLAGGLGTRLRSAIGDHPKCMAEVNGQPFLYYIFRYLEQQHCTRVILSLGYKHEVVTAWLAATQWPFEIGYTIEEQPLGTGGGIRLAIQKAYTANVAVLNGDTMFLTDLDVMFATHQNVSAATTLALKDMQYFDRYGVVNTDASGVITSFEEKQKRDSGTINGGIYIINKNAFLQKPLPEKFSFEKDYLEQYVGDACFYGHRSNAYFIDIGIPEDYAQAQEDFKTMFSR